MAIIQRNLISLWKSIIVYRLEWWREFIIIRIKAKVKIDLDLEAKVEAKAKAKAKVQS